mgnify:CR=1 FL=1
MSDTALILEQRAEVNRLPFLGLKSPGDGRLFLGGFRTFGGSKTSRYSPTTEGVSRCRPTTEGVSGLRPATGQVSICHPTTGRASNLAREAARWGAHREAPFARCAGMSAEGGCPPSNLHTASILKMWISAGCQGASEVLLAIRPADAYHSDRIARLLSVIRRAATASAVR